MKLSKPTNKIFSISNLVLALAICFILLMVLVPNFKAGIIKGFMKIGFFQPKIERTHIATALSQNNSSGLLLRNATGQELDLTSLKGKVIFINVWATWCGPCKAELPSINSLKIALQNDKNIKILTLDADGKPEKAAAFLQNQGLNLPVWTMSGKLPDFLSSSAIPLTVVLDKKGKVAFRHTGTSNYDNKNFKAFLRKLAEE